MSLVVGRYRGKLIWSERLPPSLNDVELDDHVLYITTAAVRSKVKGLIRRSGQYPQDDLVQIDVEQLIVPAITDEPDEEYGYYGER